MSCGHSSPGLGLCQTSGTLGALRTNLPVEPLRNTFVPATSKDRVSTQNCGDFCGDCSDNSAHLESSPYILPHEPNLLPPEGVQGFLPSVQLVLFQLDTPKLTDAVGRVMWVGDFPVSVVYFCMEARPP